MKKWIVAFAVLTLGTTALCLEVLEEEAIPTHIETAMKHAYKITRDDWDAFGISNIRVFTILPKASSYNIMRDVLEVTKDNSINLMRVCDKVRMGGSQEVCADYLSKHLNVRYAQSALKEMFSHEYRSTTFEQASETFIEQMNSTLFFIESFFQGRLEHIRAQGRDYMVDVLQEILIDTTREHMLIVEHDQGA